jgi:hypothetical protein
LHGEPRMGLRQLNRKRFAKLAPVLDT